MIVQNRIARLRESAGMCRQNLANSLDISDSFLGSLERQKANPSFGLALRICQVLGESMERVFPYGNVDVGPSMRGYHGQSVDLSVGGPHLSPTPDDLGPGAQTPEKAYWEPPRPIRARVLPDGEMSGLKGNHLESCGVLDSERSELQEISSYARGRGYKAGYLFHKAREEGLLFAYEHILGTQASVEDSAYGPQKARHPANAEPVLMAAAWPARPAISTLSGTILSADGWSKLSRLLRRAESYEGKTRHFGVVGAACALCGGIGRRHATECHAEFVFLIDAHRSKGGDPLGGDTGEGVQSMTALQILCPSCRKVRRVSPLDGPERSRSGFDRSAKHLKKVNHWTADQAREEMLSAVGRAQKISAIRWTLDRMAAVGVLEQILGPAHEIVAEARDRLGSGTTSRGGPIV